jgi:hypothetical protein
MQKTKARGPDGSIIDAVELEFEEQSTPWTKVKCEDGTVIMIKVEILAVTRLDAYDPVTGIPLYHVNSQPAFRVTNVHPDVRKIPNAPPERTDIETQ